MSEPSKEAMERAGALVRVVPYLGEYPFALCVGRNSILQSSEDGARLTARGVTEDIALAIDAAVMEERARKQPCGHPVACIVSTGEGANYCGWCQDREQVKREAWRDMRRACAEAVIDHELYEGVVPGDSASVGYIAHREAMRARVRSK